MERDLDEEDKEIVPFCSFVIPFLTTYWTNNTFCFFYYYIFFYISFYGRSSPFLFICEPAILLVSFIFCLIFIPSLWNKERVPLFCFFFLYLCCFLSFSKDSLKNLSRSSHDWVNIEENSSLLNGSLFLLNPSLIFNFFFLPLFFDIVFSFPL